MNLIIDIGNSFSKLFVFQEKQIIESFIVKDLDKKCIIDLKKKYKLISSVIISSVIGIKNSVSLFVEKEMENAIFLSHKTKLPIENMYKTKKSLGYDRIAAAVGANNIYRNTDVLVIDAGTAITFDFVNNKNQYLGGNISPGLSTRFKALNTFTKKLPMLSKEEDFLFFGNTTNSAIISGVQKGIIYEIEGYIDELKKKNNDFRVILTGGDAFFFESKLKNIIFAEQNLVSIGLNTILKYNVKN